MSNSINRPSLFRATPFDPQDFDSKNLHQNTQETLKTSFYHKHQTNYHKIQKFDKLCLDWASRRYNGPLFHTNKNPRWRKRSKPAFKETTGSITYTSTHPQDSNSFVENTGSNPVHTEEEGGSNPRFSGNTFNSTFTHVIDPSFIENLRKTQAPMKSRKYYLGGSFSKYADTHSNSPILQELLRKSSISSKDIVSLPLLVPHSVPTVFKTSTLHDSSSSELWLTYRDKGNSGRKCSDCSDTIAEDCTSCRGGGINILDEHDNNSSDKCCLPVNRGSCISIEYESSLLAKALAAAAASAAAAAASADASAHSAKAASASAIAASESASAAAASANFTSLFYNLDPFPGANEAFTTSVAILSTPPLTDDIETLSTDQIIPTDNTSSPSIQNSPPIVPSSISETPVLDFIEAAVSIGIMDADLFSACYIKAINEFNMTKRDSLDRYKELNILAKQYFELEYSPDTPNHSPTPEYCSLLDANGDDNRCSYDTQVNEGTSTADSNDMSDNFFDADTEKSDAIDNNCVHNGDKSLYYRTVKYSYDDYEIKPDGSPEAEIPKGQFTLNESTPHLGVKRKCIQMKSDDSDFRGGRSGNLEFNPTREVQYYNPDDAPCNASTIATKPMQEVLIFKTKTRKIKKLRKNPSRKSSKRNKPKYEDDRKIKTEDAYSDNNIAVDSDTLHHDDVEHSTSVEIHQNIGSCKLQTESWETPEDYVKLEKYSDSPEHGHDVNSNDEYDHYLEGEESEGSLNIKDRELSDYDKELKAELHTLNTVSCEGVPLPVDQLYHSPEDNNYDIYGSRTLDKDAGMYASDDSDGYLEENQVIARIDKGKGRWEPPQDSQSGFLQSNLYSQESNYFNSPAYLDSNNTHIPSVGSSKSLIASHSTSTTSQPVCFDEDEEREASIRRQLQVEADMQVALALSEAYRILDYQESDTYATSSSFNRKLPTRFEQSSNHAEHSSESEPDDFIEEEWTFGRSSKRICSEKLSESENCYCSRYSGNSRMAGIREYIDDHYGDIDYLEDSRNEAAATPPTQNIYPDRQMGDVLKPPQDFPQSYSAQIPEHSSEVGVQLDPQTGMKRKMPLNSGYLEEDSNRKLFKKPHPQGINAVDDPNAVEYSGAAGPLSLSATSAESTLVLATHPVRGEAITRSVTETRRSARIERMMARVGLVRDGEQKSLTQRVNARIKRELKTRRNRNRKMI